MTKHPITLATNGILVITAMFFGAGIYLHFRTFISADRQDSSVETNARGNPTKDSKNASLPLNASLSPLAKSSYPTSVAVGRRAPKSEEQLRKERQQLSLITLPTDPQSTIARNRLKIRSRYHELYSELKLDPEKINKFESAAALDFNGIDVFVITLGVEPGTEANLGPALKLDSLVRDTLGEDAVKSFRDFIYTSDIREFVSSVAANSFYTSEPLSRAQGRLLFELALLRSDDRGVGLRIDPNKTDWISIADDAGRFLSPSQLTVVKAVAAKRQFDAEFQKITGLPYRSMVRGF